MEELCRGLSKKSQISFVTAEVVFFIPSPNKNRIIILIIIITIIIGIGSYNEMHVDMYFFFIIKTIIIALSCLYFSSGLFKCIILFYYSFVYYSIAMILLSLF